MDTGTHSKLSSLTLIRICNYTMNTVVPSNRTELNYLEALYKFVTLGSSFGLWAFTFV